MIARPFIIVSSLLSASAAGCGDDTTGGSGGAGGSGGTTGGSSGKTTGTQVTSTSSTPSCFMGEPVSFAKDIQPIFDEACAKSMCHNASSRKESLDLSAGNAWEQIVNHASKQCNGAKIRVRPGNPDESYLLDKMRDEDLCGNSKEMPPPSDTPLFNGEVGLIERWVCQGAENN